MKRVLIAGGAGFLGSHLCDRYVKTYEVVCIDNLSTGFEKNIEHLMNLDNFVFVKADITNELPSHIREKRYDLIINMASPASPPRYQELALETLEAGSQGTKKLLELAKRDKARFFHASTSEVYGDAEVHPQPEKYWGNVNSYGPRSMYDEAKRYSETLTYVYRTKYGVDTVIARFFNTYGPRMDKNDGRVITNFISQALESRDLTVYGEGRQTRSFCYVDDLVEAIVRSVESGIEGPINLGNPGEFTVMELAQKVIEKTGSKSEIIFEPLPKDDPMQRRPDISKAKTELSWEPKVSLDEGLDLTIDYFRNLN